MNWFNKDARAFWLMKVQQTSTLLILLDYSSQVHLSLFLLAFC